MESLNNEVAKYTIKENQDRSPAFQHWDDVLEAINHTTVWRTLSTDIQVEFQVFLWHQNPAHETPLCYKERFPVERVSTAALVLQILTKSVREEMLNTLQVDMVDAPFYIMCQEEVGNYTFVIAKHSTKLVGEWFERNVRLGQGKLFKMAIVVKCYETECKWANEEMTLQKLVAAKAPMKSGVTGE